MRTDQVIEMDFVFVIRACCTGIILEEDANTLIFTAEWLGLRIQSRPRL